MTSSFGRVHTLLIPKSEDVEKVLNVTGSRPTTLSNVDYKIFTKVMSDRNQRVIYDIAGEHQICGIPETNYTKKYAHFHEAYLAVARTISREWPCSK